MLELSLHILDIAENSIRAGASRLVIDLTEDREADRLTLEIQDNGKGMTEEERKRVLDPFYTTKKVRRVGLGLPMLAQAAANTGGSLHIESGPEAGTTVRVVFGLRHIDRQPLGDLPGTVTALVAGNPDIRFVYRHHRDGRVYTLDTDEIKGEIEDIPLNHIEVLKFIRHDVEDGLREINAEA